MGNRHGNYLRITMAMLSDIYISCGMFLYEIKLVLINLKMY